MAAVVAVVPTLGKNQSRLTATIDSIKRNTTHENLQIVVVKNSDANLSYLDDKVDTILSFGVNLGNVGSLEYVRRHYSCEYLWILQDDMVILNNNLEALISSFVVNPKLAVASPIVSRFGTVPARSRAGVFTNIEKTRWENYPFTDIAVEDVDLSYDFCFVAGSGALFRTEALSAVGGFDLNLYPLMHVDVDICIRLLRAGWQICLNPEALIDHQVSGSRNARLSKAVLQRNTQYLHDRLETDFTEHVESYTPLDEDILFAIARRSSQLFLEVSEI